MAEQTEGTEAEVEETGTETTETSAAEPQPDLAAQSRKWERRSKANLKEIEALKAQLKDREELDKSATEKAIEAARQEGEKIAREAAAAERRSDRLENATIRLAATGFKVTTKGEDGEDTSTTLKFADPDDAFTYIERMIRRGDLDEDELFDEGKVQTPALTNALQELLAAKPHLVAGSGNGDRPTRVVQGSADSGKGSGGGKGLEDLSVAEHFARLHPK